MSPKEDNTDEVKNELSEADLEKVAGGTLAETEARLGIDIDVAINPSNGERTIVITG